MNKILLIALLLWYADLLHAQAIPYPSPDLKNGRYNKETSTYRVAGLVRHHKKQGRWIVQEPRRNSSGENEWVTTLDVHFHDDQYHGPYTSFTVGGDTISTGAYCNDRRCGQWRTYNGKQLVAEEYYDDAGNYRAVSNYYTPEGKLERRKQVDLDGTVIDWLFFPDGRLNNYSIVHGDERTVYWFAPYYPSMPRHDSCLIRSVSWKGTRKQGSEYTFAYCVKTSETWYRDGNLDSVNRKWNNGMLVYEAYYTSGQLSGMERKWTDSGKLYAQNFYQNGSQHGVQVVYDTASSFVLQQEWRVKGIFDSLVKYSSSGTVMYRAGNAWANGLHFTYTTYHNNGNPASQGTIDDGREVGVQQQWYGSGVRRAAIGYRKGNPDGAIDFWNEKGVHVFHSDAEGGYDTVPELVWNDNGVKLQYGTKAYDAQREKYRPDNLFLYSDTVFFTHAVQAINYMSERTWTSGGTDVILRMHDTTATNKRVPPQFPGGSGAQLNYFRRGLRYPQLELEMGKSGTVYVEFIVEKDGSITGAHIAKPAAGAPGLGKEAQRLVTAMPTWKPAMKNGKVIRSKCVMKFEWIIEWHK